MSPPSQLWKLKNSRLTKLLVSIGARSTGTKGVMVEQLVWDCGRAKLVGEGQGSGLNVSSGLDDSRSLDGSKKLPGLKGSRELPDLNGSSLASTKETTRILSIDMGIKNLAFCVCDVPVLSAPTKATARSEESNKKQSESALELSIVAWKRIAVTGSTTPIGRKKKAVSEDVDADVEVEEKKETNQAYVEGDDPFSPMQLSKTAYKLVREVLLPYKPDTILIERQRFRSGGGSAVQEWTVRVNMFESMIWAVLTTLKNEGNTRQPKLEDKKEEEKVTRPHIWDVSPMRVASFWIGNEAKKTKKVRVKVEKKEKVDLVQRWILADAEGIEINEAVNITFQDGAARTRDAFMAMKSGPNRKPATLRKIKEPKGIKESKMKKESKMVAVPVVELPDVPGTSVKELLQKEPLLDIGKLDDLADCLLQAGAWTKWEMNRLAVNEMIKEEDVEGLEEWIRDHD